MRLTLRLCRINYRRMRNDLWKRKGYVRSIPAPRPWYLEGKEIVDPNAAHQVRQQVDPLPDTQQFRGAPTPEHHPNYHPDPDDFVYEFHNSTRLMEGVKQACILTKTQPKYGLPKAVLDNVGVLQIPEQDMLVQRYIMQANVWDPTKEKLPVRINTRLPGWRFKRELGIPEERKRSTLVQNLVRLCRMIGGRYPDLVQTRSVLPDPYLSVTYIFNGDKPVLIRGVQESLLTSDRPLERFASEEEVDQTATFNLPDLQPLAPTIDLLKQKIYREGENITGYSADFACSHPHTLLMHTGTRHQTREVNAKILMHSFGRCLAMAKARYGADVKKLEEPIVLQTVLTNGADFHFSCFQLNTVDFDSSNGIKNIAWFDNDNAMYRRILPERAMLRNTRYEDYDPEVFKKLLGLYVNGADVQTEWLERNVSKGPL